VLPLLPRHRSWAPQPPSVLLPTAPPPLHCHLLLPFVTPLQPGQYILWEDAPLDDSAKFYMVESGSVDCFRTFEVGGLGEASRHHCLLPHWASYS
jgi:hypothetical protein